MTSARFVVVTGGAGFIGANLCRAFCAVPSVEGVVVLDDFSTGRADNLAGLEGLRIIEGSILDPQTLDQAIAEGATIVHLAARPSVVRSIEDPMATHEANVTGTIRVLEAARRHGAAQVIVASSSSVYGPAPSLPAREDATPRPISPYAASKLATESYALSYQASFGVPVTAFRFFNVFGPLQRADHAYAAVVPAFVAAALSGDPIPVHGDGTQTRDFTYVGSVVRVIVQAVLDRVSSPQPVNLAFGGRYSLLQLVEILGDVLGSSLTVAHGDPRPGDVHDSQADQSLLHSLFPEVSPVPLHDGLEATVDWFRQIQAPLGSSCHPGS